MPALIDFNMSRNTRNKIETGIQSLLVVRQRVPRPVQPHNQTVQGRCRAAGVRQRAHHGIVPLLVAQVDPVRPRAGSCHPEEISGRAMQ